MEEMRGCQGRGTGSSGDPGESIGRRGAGSATAAHPSVHLYSGRMSRDVEAVHVSGVQELFGRQPGKQISLPHGVTALRTYRGVALEKHEHQKSGDGPDSICPKELAVPGETYISGTSWIISCRIYERTEQNAEVEIPQKSYTKCFDYDIIKHTPSARRSSREIIWYRKRRGKTETEILFYQ